VTLITKESRLRGIFVVIASPKLLIVSTRLAHLVRSIHLAILALSSKLYKSSELYDSRDLFVLEVSRSSCDLVDLNDLDDLDDFRYS